MKCKSSKPVTLKGKKQYPKNITTEPACKKLKQAARLHNDEHFLFIMSGDEDLIAKEFKMHEKCYKDYTRICSRQPVASTSKESNENEDSYGTGENGSKIDHLCEFVRTHILEGEQSVSIKLLTEVYGLDKEDCRLRGKVKEKLLQQFGDELLFITVSSNEAQVVMSKQALLDTKQCNFLC